MEKENRTYYTVPELICHCEELCDEAIFGSKALIGRRDCFASLAMTNHKKLPGRCTYAKAMLPPAPNLAYLLLGANLGDRTATFDKAQQLLTEQVGKITMASARYETAPWGGAAVEGQPPYLNQVVVVDTLLDPFALLRRLLAIEKALGRVRDQPWQARTLDLDLLIFGGIQLDFGPDLILPHPRIAERRFVLVPLHEVAPQLLVPGAGGLTVGALLAQCPDPLEVQRVG